MPFGLNAIVESKAYTVFGDQVGINIRHWKITSQAGLGLTGTQLADEFSKAVALLYKPWLATTARYVGCTVQDITTLPAPAAVISSLSAGDGTFSGDPLPRQTAGLIHLRAATGGRHGRGRVYLPFCSEAGNDAGGFLNLDAINRGVALSVFYGTPRDFSVALDASRLTPQIFDRVARTVTAVATHQMDDRWATQRRRGSFGRINSIPF